MERGICCSVHFIPLHLQPFFIKELNYKCGDFPVSEDVFRRIFSLPLYPKMSSEEIREVARSLRELIEKYKK